MIEAKVLLSPAIHFITNKNCRNDNDIRAWQLATTAKLKANAVFVGDETNECLADYLAAGIPEITVINSDKIVEALLGFFHANPTKIIITGAMAKGGADTGLLPYLLAHNLKYQVISSVLGVKNISATELEILQYLPKGKRRKIITGASTVLISSPYTDLAPSYSYANSQTGKIKLIDVHELKPTKINFAKANSNPKIRTLAKKKITVTSNKSAHSRLQSIVASKNIDGQSITDGTAQEKAKVLLEYLNNNLT